MQNHLKCDELLIMNSLCFPDLDSKLKHTTGGKDLEIAQLTERLKVREAEISHMRDEDAQRANILQSAIQTYVTKSPYSGPRWSALKVKYIWVMNKYWFTLSLYFYEMVICNKELRNKTQLLSNQYCREKCDQLLFQADEHSKYLLFQYKQDLLCQYYKQDLLTMYTAE